jgi:hypothetical protein
MKVIIAGGRDYVFTTSDIQLLNRLRIQIPITEVVSGGARGADHCGEEWANKHNIPIKLFPANWDKHGKAAGAKRNKQMAQYADAVILFPGGRGTDCMFELAGEEKIKIFDYRHGEDNDLAEFI